jgi:hypothetical protein
MSLATQVQRQACRLRVLGAFAGTEIHSDVHGVPVLVGDVCAKQLQGGILQSWEDYDSTLQGIPWIDSSEKVIYVRGLTD